MAYQLSDIRSKVLMRVRDPSFSGAEADSFINDTINDIFNEYQLPFMEEVTTLSSTIGSQTLTLPTNYGQAIDLIYTTTGGEKVIPYVDSRLSDEIDPDQADLTRNPSADVPEYWYYYANSLKVFPAAKKVYTLQLRYYKKPTLLTEDTSVPELPSQYEEILVVGAVYRILQVKDNYDQAAIFQNKYDELLDKLVFRSSRIQTGSPKIMRINRRHVGRTSF